MGKLLQIHTLSFFHPTLAREDVFSTEPMRDPAISEYAASHTLSDVTPGDWTPGGARMGTRRSLPTEGTTWVSYYKSILFL